MNVVVLIPAYNPDKRLVDLVEELAQGGFSKILVVNDGSKAECAPVFEAIKRNGHAELLVHAVNLGKGAALKTGFDRVCIAYPGVTGVITADADGQHCPEDIRKVAEDLERNPKCLILGARQFDKDVPWRSMFGNKLTSTLMRIFLGMKISDTQTGLRGVPYAMLPALLDLPFNRYEYELEMLLLSKREGFPLREVVIATIYLEGNASSHFNPVFDSAKIYFVLFRYVLASIATALVDYIVFLASLPLIGSIMETTFVSRGAAVLVNYFLVKNMVFSSREKILKTFPKYLLLVAASGFLSASAVEYLTATFGMKVVLAKALAECVLYLANFVIQRDFIFASSREESRPTDWDSYFEAPCKFASVSRRSTRKRLLALMAKWRPRTGSFVLAELGGGGSCFFKEIMKRLKPDTYFVFDRNRRGIEQLKTQAGEDSAKLRIKEIDILEMTERPEADLAFSAGLIEHFDHVGTRKAVEAHFDAVKPGGVVILLFPTPTFLYKLSRFLAEVLHLWIFHDERALRVEEVESCAASRGELLGRGMIWGSVFTQAYVVARRRS